MGSDARTPESIQATGVQIPPLLSASREGELAARVIGEVIRQGYYPALRASKYIAFMAAGRTAAWEAWRETLRGFGGSMFQHPFIALAERVGLEGANAAIDAFAREFAGSFEGGLDLEAAGTPISMSFDHRDQARMQDWLSLLEKTERFLSPVLDQMYGPGKKPSLFGRLRWIPPAAGGG